METSRSKLFVRSSIGVALWFCLVLGCAASSNSSSKSQLTIREAHNHIVLDNGIVSVTLVQPGGLISAVTYEGIHNVLEYHSTEYQRGYWDLMWKRLDNNKGTFDTMRDSSFKYSVVLQTEDQIEVSFKRTWDPANDDGGVPLNIDKRFVLLRGSSGFYSYAIFEHLEGWPALNVDNIRLTFKLSLDKFNYMAISDDRQRVMPSGHDRISGRVLDYKEAVLLTDPSNHALKGEVDDKYQYSSDNSENKVHGWISDSPHVGFWMVTPSDEFRAGSPLKTDLTSHAGPTTLAIFYSGHYAGPDFRVSLSDGEPWKKVFGPVFIYLNSDSSNDHKALWEDAKAQYTKETMKWPYEFPQSQDFPRSAERGSISGRLLVRDRYMDKNFIPAKSAHVGLAAPGAAGSWQSEVKGYQFWTQADENGYFSISNVREGIYNLYAWIPGVIGDYRYENNIVIRRGNVIPMGNLVYYPPRSGPTLWEIGIPDRTAAEFFVPDPAPDLVNKLYLHSKTEKFRQYGLWDRYTDLYPTRDLVYTIGRSDYRKDWFFAHVTRRYGNDYIPTQWTVAFDIRRVNRAGTYTLVLALASANFAEIQVHVNDQNGMPLFSTGRIGRDNAIARHGIHGLYSLYNVNIPGIHLVNGLNSIYLKQSRGGGPFIGAMYDYLRLEGPRRI